MGMFKFVISTESNANSNTCNTNSNTDSNGCKADSNVHSINNNMFSMILNNFKYFFRYPDHVIMQLPLKMLSEKQRIHWQQINTNKW